MSLRPPDRSLLEDMLDWARKVQRFVSDVSHDYLGVDVDEVWRTATVDLPELERRLLVALGRG